MSLYPLKFTPILAERVWGGHTLARFGKNIATGHVIGESWEISDRDDAASVVAHGPLAGRTLRQLIEQNGPDLLGTNVTGSRFPLLIKLLDARDRLSLQVHPPAAIAPQLGGEPKTEMWYVMDAAPDAHLIAGLKPGTTRAQFEQALRESGSSPGSPSCGSGLPAATGPQLEPLLHRFPVHTGDTLFVPSGRLHAIDAGLVIAEIQQNSDTTYRVYDWGRVGLDGKPRSLHVKESLACIDFNDFAPPLSRYPITCEHFIVDQLDLTGPRTDRCDGTTFHVLGCVAGQAQLTTSTGWEGDLHCGDWLLLPANLGNYTLTGVNTRILIASVPADTSAAGL